MPAADFFKLFKNPIAFRLYLLKKLPAAFFAGVRITEANPATCTASVPYGWRTQNPFRSTYFACQAMAAEMSTGILAMAAIYKRDPPLSMLVVSMESTFHKKATGTTYFTCSDGALVQQTVSLAQQTGVGQSIRLHSKGVNSRGELIAEFWITWSFKSKSKNV